MMRLVDCSLVCNYVTKADDVQKWLLMETWLQGSKQVCGMTKCPPRHRETWWWNRAVEEALQNDTTYKQWSCHIGHKLLCKLCRALRPQQWGPDFPFLGQAGPAGWLALLLIKAGNVDTNPGQTNTHNQVWICDICHKQIHVRKQISIRCNRTEHWVT